MEGERHPNRRRVSDWRGLQCRVGRRYPTDPTASDPSSSLTLGMTASSSVNCEHAAQFGNVFAVFDPICENSKCERLRSGERFLAARSVRENPWKINNLTDPTIVVLELDFHREVAHVGIQLRRRVDLPSVNVLRFTDATATR